MNRDLPQGPWIPAKAGMTSYGASGKKDVIALLVVDPPNTRGYIRRTATTFRGGEG